MRILAIHNIGFADVKKESGVQIWRIWRPLEELRKHVDWTIDYQQSFIKDIDQYKDFKDFSEEELEKAAEHLGSYDIVFYSYHADFAAHCLMLGPIAEKYGTKFVMDDDDNTFAIEPENPFWTNMTEEHAFYMQRINRTSPYITTTTENLKQVFSERSECDAKVFVLPNYIPDSYTETEPEDNGRIDIGYFGGAGHYIDFEQTGIIPALRRIMHEHKNVHFTSVGVPIQEYLPKARYHLEDVVYGRKFVTDLFPTLKFDIGLAPLRKTIFADGKSNIKWQEYTRMGAAFVGSNAGPYKTIKKGTGLLVENDEDSWYKALKEVVENETKRKSLVKASRTELKAYRLEDHWQDYKKVFEEIHND